jgi:adenylylsulfate kinase
VVWLTGLPAAGKTTLGVALEWRLLREGHLAYLLDSEWFRHTLSADLDFTPEGRGENVRRASEVASFFADAGVIAIAAFVSPFRTERQKARRVMTPGRFFEVFLECPVEICAKRDTTGFYAKARTGEIRDYTGVGSPYEVPDNADLVLPTGQLTVDESVERLVEFLRGQGVLRRTGRHGMGAGRL